MSDRVVGNDDCDTREVVDTLFESKSLTGLTENWKTIARDLGLLTTKVNQLDVKRRNEESIEEIWFLMLDAWAGAKGDEAKLSILLGILRKPKYTTKDAADKLQAKFGIAVPAAPTQQAAAPTQQVATPVPPTPSGILNLEEQLRQIAHIDKYSPMLIQRTQVNVSLTSTLVSLGVFSSDDVDKLDAILAANEKSKAFYKIVTTKDNFYPHLITALDAGNQTGAVAILKAI